MQPTGRLASFSKSGFSCDALVRPLQSSTRVRPRQIGAITPNPLRTAEAARVDKVLTLEALTWRADMVRDASSRAAVALFGGGIFAQIWYSIKCQI